jgi:hypothetical protein
MAPLTCECSLHPDLDRVADLRQLRMASRARDGAPAPARGVSPPCVAVAYDYTFKYSTSLTLRADCPHRISSP